MSKTTPGTRPPSVVVNRPAGTAGGPRFSRGRPSTPRVARGQRLRVWIVGSLALASSALSLFDLYLLLSLAA